jgi:hypothetical protein
MRRVVVTGLGIVASIGNNSQEVARSLRAGKSGIEFIKEYEELGFRSRIAGTVNIDIEGLIDRKLRRFMGNSAAYNYIAMQEAVADSGLAEDQVSNTRTGLIAGSGGASTENVSLAIDLLREKGIRRVGPYMVPRTMSSTNSACLATPFRIHGVNYSISSACSTSAHCIGNGCELIQFGKQDIVFAGGGEELHWTLTLMFDAMGALSSKYNEAPVTALSSPAAVAWWYWKSWSMPGHVARRFTLKSLATAPLRMAMTWCSPRVKAPCAACSRQWKPLTSRSTTSMLMAPAHRSVICASWRPSETCLVKRFPGSPRPSHCPAIHSALPVSTRQSIHC